MNLPKKLSKLQAASENISSVLNSQEILNTITKEFASLLPATTVSLSRLDETTNMLVVVSEYEAGRWVETELGVGFPLSEYAFTESVLKYKEIKQFTVNDPLIEASELALLHSYKMKSILLIPFVKQEKLIGLVEIYNREEKTYDENDLMMARLLSSTAAVAFENANLFEEIQQGYIQQKALHESAIIISSSLELDTILTKISEQVCRLLDVTSVYISNYDPETQTYCILAEAFSEYASEAERKSDLGTTYDYIPEKGDSSKPGRQHTLQHYHIDDPGLHRHRYQHLRKFGGNSVLEIPLQASGKINAIIMVWESRYRREFTPREIALCETIALQASIALENATLYCQTQEELKQRKKLEEEFRHKALHDALTHLPNRVLFFDRLEQAIKKKNRNPHADFAVFYIDLDNFKQVNDTFGHSEGDRVLRIVAQRFGGIIREMDTVARFGGDEFLMLVEDIFNEEVADQFTERIHHRLNQPIMVNGKIIRLTCSIGYTTSTQGLVTSQDYINGADNFMYTVKHLSKKNQKLAVEPFSTSPAEIANVDWLGLEP